MKILAVRKSERKAKTYGIETADHTFCLANGAVTHNTFDMYSPDEIAGGGGFKYAASIIVLLSKRKEKDGKKIIGNVIHCKQFKGRMTKENEQVDTLIRYDTGLSRWYGMMTLATESGVFGKAGSYIVLPDGTKKYASVIMKDPHKYFTDDIMQKIDTYCHERFTYGCTANEDDADENIKAKESESDE